MKIAVLGGAGAMGRTVAAEFVARGDALTTGAVPPEVAFDPDTVLDALTERGIVIEETRVS